jgi:nitrite reductase/ring-hydroxylating ferredoxin subunit
MTTTVANFLHAASLAQLRKTGLLTLQLDGHTIALFEHADQLYAIDNRCPHMGFPLDKGTVRDGILACYWHYARFDLASGGTFDQWADDVRSFPVELRDDEIYIDVALHQDPRVRQQERLAVGLERDIPLVIGKAMMTLLDSGDDRWAGDPVLPFRTGLLFGAKYRDRGWGQGLTILVAMMNLYPHLAPEDRPRALYHGLAAVARDSAGHPPRFCVPPLPSNSSDLATLKRWFRQFIEVRDNEGAERCIVSALRAGADHRQMADMLFAAATDHRYIDVGHPLDFTNKAFEALDIIGWEYAEPVLTSLVMGYASARRMEESNAWRSPIDLIALLTNAFVELPVTVAVGRQEDKKTGSQEELIQTLLGDDPQATVDALLTALHSGWGAVALAQTVARAAALRIARFHTSNEFGDWDTALHTFTFANAVHQGLLRAPSVELLRGVFDAAMSIYLDRFLNIPAARLPTPPPQPSPDSGKGAHLEELTALLDRQQQVNQAGQKLAHYLYGGGHADHALAHLGKLLLREDRDFHTIQSVEAAFRQYSYLLDQPEGVNLLVASMRYLAAHAPTVRAQGQTFEIARRLHRDEKLFEGE